MQHLNLKSNLGFSAASTMVAMSLSIILLFTIYKFFNHEYRYFNYANSKILLEDLRSQIRISVSCETTLPATLPVPCTTSTGGPIDVFSKSASSTPLIPIPVGGTFKRVGVYALRGWCKDNGGNPKLTIQVNRLSPSGSSAIGDPLKNRLMDGTSPPPYSLNTVGWIDLFAGVPVCL